MGSSGASVCRTAEPASSTLVFVDSDCPGGVVLGPIVEVQAVVNITEAKRTERSGVEAGIDDGLPRCCP